MIAYFAPLPTALSLAIAHKLYNHHDNEAVLYVDKGMYDTRGLSYVADTLKEEGIFKDVVIDELICPKVLPMNVDDTTAEKYICDFYDNFFAKTPYKLQELKKIYVLVDNWGAHFNVYFNIKRLRYIWIELSKNVYQPEPHPTINGCFKSITSKYKAFSPLAEYADAVIDENSNKTLQAISHCDNKEVILFNKKKCYSSISDEDMEKLYNVFKFNNLKDKLSNTSESILLLKNSDQFYLDGINLSDSEVSLLKKYIGYSNYTKKEIYSLMDMVCIEFFSPNVEKIYIKFHINDPLSEDETRRLYGENAIVLPHAPFEFVQPYFEKVNAEFNTVIGAVSTSLGAITEKENVHFYPLGWMIARTWWFYISLYTVLFLVSQIGYKIIYANSVIPSQLKNLSDKLNYGIDIIKFEPDTANNIKNSIIVIDLCDGSAPDFPHEKTDKSNAVAFINDSLTERFIDSDNCELYTPISIKKDKLTEPVCDILYRKETVWVYSGDPEIRKKARQCKFERELKFLGMRIHADGITLPESVEMFCARKSVFKTAETNIKLAEIEKQTERLKLFIQKPRALLSLLKSTTDINEYLDIIDILKHKYVIMLAVRDTPGNCLALSTLDRLKRLGFTDFSKQLWVMYAGMLGKGAVICNKRGESPEDGVEFTHTDINSGIKFELKSQAWRKGNKAEIFINGKNYSVNLRGLNIVVYDIDNDVVLDSIGYDKHEINERFVRNNG